MAVPLLELGWALPVSETQEAGKSPSVWSTWQGKNKKKQMLPPKSPLPGIRLPMPPVIATEMCQAFLRAAQSPAAWPSVGKGMTHLSRDECRKRFFFPQAMYLIKLSWVESLVLMLEFFILSWSWSDFKLGGTSYLCLCLYLRRTACPLMGSGD